MQYVVFATEAAFDAYEALAYAAWMAEHDDQNGYTEDTTSWAVKHQRLTDGKYVAEVCPCITDHGGYTIEEEAADWWPVVEI